MTNTDITLYARSIGGEVAVTRDDHVVDIARLSPTEARLLARQLERAADDAEGLNT